MQTYLRPKLTRAVEEDPRREKIEVILSQDLKRIWQKSEIEIPHILVTPPLENCLRMLHLQKMIERGLEHIDSLLKKEQKGLSAVQKKQGAASAERVSRLVIVSNDGSERFYRSCEKLLNQNRDRLMMVQVNVDSTRLAESVFKSIEKPVKALLVADRDAVTQVLLSLVSLS